MALTRKLLKSFGLEESVVDSIIEAHAETVDGLKNQITEATKAAESITAVTKERDELKNQLDELKKAGGDAAKVQQEFDDYKASIEAEKTAAKKRGAMETLLRDQVGIKRESARRLIMDAMDFGSYELDGDAFKDADTIAANLKQTHAEWIGEEKTEGVPPLAPPSGGGSGMTKDDIMKIADPAERRQAIAKNLTLFQ